MFYISPKVIKWVPMYFYCISWVTFEKPLRMRASCQADQPPGLRFGTFNPGLLGRGEELGLS